MLKDATEIGIDSLKHLVNLT